MLLIHADSSQLLRDILGPSIDHFALWSHTLRDPENHQALLLLSLVLWVGCIIEGMARKLLDNCVYVPPPYVTQANEYLLHFFLSPGIDDLCVFMLVNLLNVP